MFCVIEGADNSGKSTLGQFLSSKLGVTITHSGGPGKDKVEFFDRINRLCNHSEPVIFDRFPVISEHVYAPIVRNVDTFEGRIDTYRHLFRSRDPIVIYCRPPLEVLLDLKDHKAKPEHEDADHVASVVRNALPIIQRYDQVMVEEYPDALHYDYTAGGPQFRTLLLSFLKMITPPPSMR